ncbi:MAG TPA: hypothetical protein P5016_21610, partial [Verrucomicrobiales bacterium]|nr:hypothetical protein [Verrucomicrobiales bacterium]
MRFPRHRQSKVAPQKFASINPMVFFLAFSDHHPITGTLFRFLDSTSGVEFSHGLLSPCSHPILCMIENWIIIIID